MNEETSYRTSHSAPGYGKRYSANYSLGYYAAIFREFESPIIKKLFAKLSNESGSYLDFACGTGRITRLSEPYFDRVVGVDVSEAMLQIARAESKASYIQQDITKNLLNERFTVVTVFRFFLNAEDTLRSEALAAIRKHMTPDGRLICNIHMNSQSVMGVFYRLTKRIPGIPNHETLSYHEFKRILSHNGFAVEEVIWYGVLPRPGRFFARFIDRWLGPTERLLGAVGLRGRFAHSFIIVARLSDVPQAELGQS